MPELPEVETMRRGLLSLVGRRVRCVLTPPCSFRPITIEPKVELIHQHLEGQIVHDVTRVGKRVLIHAGSWALALQPKMTGLATMNDVPDPEHVRLVVEMQGKPNHRLQFWDRRGLGTVELIAADRIHQHLIEGKLGPDALCITHQEFHQRITTTSRPIKVALMDQKILAGVGNLYASEMLHAASINPRTAACRLSTKRTALLHQCMLEILERAILYEGSTLSDGTYRNSLNNYGGYQNEHRVYDREGQACSNCLDSTIRRIVQAQRSTFYCPKCQR